MSISITQLELKSIELSPRKPQQHQRTRSFRPLIKWPGGKSTEFEYIQHLIPGNYQRYIEPFFGGGAVYFRLAPQEAIINDIADELIDLYRFIKGDLDRTSFSIELLAYAENWDKISSYIKVFENKLNDIYSDFAFNKISGLELQKLVEKTIESEERHFNGLFNIQFCIDEKNLLKQIKKNISQKLIRTVDIEKKVGGFKDGDLEKNIETAFRSGFYMHFRDLLNHGTQYKLSREKVVANWYFIREYCYGAMFRYNDKGEFNIPYGGMAYNNKKFRDKVNYLLSEEIRNLFSHTEIFKEDFEALVSKIDFKPNDFMFLDPPYDTDFSSYEGNVFDVSDQLRLANFLYGCRAKWIMIIKDTPYISSLYRDKRGIVVESFEKNYLYNIKGRNLREVSHLVIRNYS